MSIGTCFLKPEAIFLISPFPISISSAYNSSDPSSSHTLTIFPTIRFILDTLTESSYLATSFFSSSCFGASFFTESFLAYFSAHLHSISSGVITSFSPFFLFSIYFFFSKSFNCFLVSSFGSSSVFGSFCSSIFAFGADSNLWDELLTKSLR